MADNVTVDNATNGDYSVVADEITSPYTGGTHKAQGVKLLDGTVDSTTVIAAGGGVEANALRVTLASDSTGVVSVDDNGGSLTVDGTVGVSGTVTVDSELTTGDLDTGAGTDTRAVVGLVGSKSGGGEIIPGDATNGLLVNLGANNDVTVTGTVTADLAAGTNNIGDVDVLTVPAPLSTTGGGTEATALRVTLASDSTGLVSVDDNAGSLTVDAPVATPVFVRLSDGASAIATLPVSIAATVTTKETRSGTATTTQVADTAVSATILASNANRLGASIANDSSARLYIKLGTTASTTDYTVSLPQNGYYEVPNNYTGRIDGIWASDPNDGAARVTELT